MLKIYALIFMGIFITEILEAQVFYRIEADFSIKEKSSSGSENLMMGRVFYDKNIRQTVFNISFPEKEILLINDTATIQVNKGTYSKHTLGTNLLDFSVFSLFLHGDLEYFGLHNTPFELEKVEHDQDQVISTWILKNEYIGSETGKLLLSQKDGKLNGLITFNSDSEIVSKQLFLNYINIENLPFPSRVIQILYQPDGSELKKITDYSNVILNSNQNEEFYHYRYYPDNK